MNLNSKNEIMLRYKGGKDLYHFFSVVSKCPPAPANRRCSRCPPALEVDVPLRVPAGARLGPEEVPAAAACALLPHADLARVGGEQVVAHRADGRRLHAVLPQQAAGGQGAREALLLGHPPRHQARLRQVPHEGRDRVPQPAAGVRHRRPRADAADRRKNLAQDVDRASVHE